MSSPQSRTSLVIGLLGEHIRSSLAAPLQEGEGAAQGRSLAYRLIDAAELGLGLGLDAAGDVLAWAVRLGFDGLNVTHPFKNVVVDLVDELSPEATALGAVNTVVIRDGRTVGHNTDWNGFASGLSATLPQAKGRDAVLLGAGGAGVAVGYGALRAGVRHLRVVDTDRVRAEAVVERLVAALGPGRATVHSDVATALDGAGGLIQATPVGMTGVPGMPLDPLLVDPGQWVAEIIYFPLETELVHAVRARGCATMTGGAMAVFQHAAAYELFTGERADAARMAAHFTRLTGLDVLGGTTPTPTGEPTAVGHAS
ncbi:shikimate dehydrogenase [Intrasporangium oryzae NRRL B-24470]|uniref:Shikimate dehydrogenase n=1 Tax=Intrasporangium oryzae NRRL B-24470 TaxID=1386089 RepID=W9GFP6_9MICO|nr:shikimate dehydrogenase [Intrasporangium oryzae]EWT02704.1 shikimate dehydrogenase [Intrasporangium oryzae NRRL B-24470]